MKLNFHQLAPAICYFYILCILGFCGLSFPYSLLAQSSSHPILDQVFEEEERQRRKRNRALRTDWPYYTEDKIEQELKQMKKWKEMLSGVSYSSLSEEDQINYDLFVHILEDRIFNLEYASYLMPLNSEGGFVTGILYNIQGVRLRDQQAEQNYLLKLKTLPAYLDRQIQLLEKGLEVGKTVPRIIVEKCLKIIKSFADATPAQSIFLEAFTKSGKKGRALDEAYRLTKEEILPAYHRLYTFVEEEYLPATRKEIGARTLPQGAAYYEQRVRFFTTLDIGPEDVFEKGREEVKRIRTEMDAILQELEFEGSFEDFLKFLRTDPQFYAKTPEELLQKAAWLSKKAEAFLPRYFGHLPRMPFTVEPVPAAIAPNYTGGRYSEGSYRNRKPGAYWVNTYKLETRPLYVLPSLTLHEAVPGHHTQIMLAAEIQNMPSFRSSTYLSAFGEGWALYAEYLGKEAGMYETPYEDFGRLVYEMWRACRLVVDVGMHYKGWSRQKALDFMAENTALSLHEVETEIDRYIGWPAQALSYKMGELTIRRLRKEAEQALGEKFDIREFHDEILKNGAITMNSLQRVFTSYLKRTQK